MRLVFTKRANKNFKLVFQANEFDGTRVSSVWNEFRAGNQPNLFIAGQRLQ